MDDLDWFGGIPILRNHHMYSYVQWTTKLHTLHSSKNHWVIFTMVFWVSNTRHGQNSCEMCAIYFLDNVLNPENTPPVLEGLSHNNSPRLPDMAGINPQTSRMIVEFTTWHKYLVWAQSHLSLIETRQRIDNSKSGEWKRDNSGQMWLGSTQWYHVGSNQVIEVPLKSPVYLVVSFMFWFDLSIQTVLDLMNTKT